MIRLNLYGGIHNSQSFTRKQPRNRATAQPRNKRRNSFLQSRQNFRRQFSIPIQRSHFPAQGSGNSRQSRPCQNQWSGKLSQQSRFTNQSSVQRFQWSGNPGQWSAVLLQWSGLLRQWSKTANQRSFPKNQRISLKKTRISRIFTNCRKRTQKNAGIPSPVLSDTLAHRMGEGRGEVFILNSQPSTNN